MVSSLFVWTRSIHPEGLPIVVGQLAITEGMGEFIYGKSYLSRPQAFALDPVNLPLQEDKQLINSFNGIPGVFTDAGPDAWGRKVIAALTGETSDLSLLVHGNGHGAGGLVFSPSLNQRPRQHARIEVNSLNDLEQALEKITSGHIQELTEEERQLLGQGSSIGGARPKAAILYQGAEHIAKFNRPNDLFNHALVEHATMTLARATGIDVAESHIEKINGEWVYLTQRFDRLNGNAHYISVASLFNKTRLNPADYASNYSYMGIAQIIGRICDDVADQRHELYRRMIFNLLMHNTDDHGKNHGFLMTSPGQFKLTPAFDLLPHLGNDQHALGIGAAGREGTLSNARSKCKEFGLAHAEAEDLIDQVIQHVRDWQQHFANTGVSSVDIDLLAPAINGRLKKSLTR